MSDVRVSIGIPTIGDHSFIEETLASALANLPDDGEIVLSDNASNIADRLQRFAADHPHRRITIVRQAERLAMADNWNACLHAARGTYFLLLSDDDVLKPTMLGTLTAVLDADPHAGFAYARFDWIDERGQRFWTSPPARDREHPADVIRGVFARRRVVLPSATLFRRQDLIDIGGYDASYENWADMAAWMTIGARYECVRSGDDVLMQYRERKSSLTKMLGDERWARGVDRTIDLLRRAYPDQRDLPLRGERYKHYLLADIALKRLLVAESSPWVIATRTFALAARLPLRERLWLTAKSVYLRLFAKINASR